MRQTVKRIFLCLLLCAAAVIAGCRQDRGPEEGGLSVYYQDAEGTKLVRESCEAGKGSVRDQVGQMLMHLKAEPEDKDCRSVFAGGVDVRDFALEDTELMLHFNAEYRKLKPAAELLLRAAVVQSLVQIEGVDYVFFYIEDQPLTDKEGRELGYMDADDFVQNTGSSLHSYQKAELKLYFASEKGDRLSVESLNTRYNSNMSIERLIVEKLLEGPKEAGDKPVIPPGTKILGVSTRDGVCYVNFDEGFLNIVDQVSPRVTVYSLVNSIVDGGTTGRVQILVNGEANVMYQETIDLSKPLSRDSEIIETETEGN